MPNGNGGIENYLMNYYRHIDKSKIQFDFINMYDNLFYSQEIKNLGGCIYNVIDYKKNLFKHINQIKKIINENSYYIIHCNMNSAVNIFSLIAAKLSTAKIIIAHSHNSSSDKGILKKIIHWINKHFIHNLANNYFACSELAGKWFFAKKVIINNRLKIIKNAIEINNFIYDINIRKKARIKLNIDDNFVIGHIGRFNKQKNHKFLIDIFYSINKKKSNSILLLIGLGELENEIKEYVDKLALSEKVYFLGLRSDINILLQAMDIFILPSFYEGLPLVGVEAQTSGLPILASDTITKELKITDLVKFLSLTNNPEIWAEEAINLYAKTKRKNMAYDIIEMGYDIDNAANYLQEFYLNNLNN